MFLTNRRRAEICLQGEPIAVECLPWHKPCSYTQEWGWLRDLSKEQFLSGCYDQQTLHTPRPWVLALCFPLCLGGALPSSPPCQAPLFSVALPRLPKLCTLREAASELPHPEPWGACNPQVTLGLTGSSVSPSFRSHLTLSRLIFHN